MTDTPRPCLVLVPGLACDAAVWQPVWPFLAQASSPWVPPIAVQDDIGEMAQALLDAAPAPQFDLAGHSLGGRIALEVVRRAPHRVRRLALLDTGWHALPEGEAGQAEARHRQALVALARQQGMRAMARQWAPPMLHPARLDTPVFEDVLDMVARQSVERFEAQQSALIWRPDAWSLLPTIQQHSLVLCGQEDSWAPPERHRQMAARLPRSKLVLVPDCGHMSPMEQPQAVASALLQWLKTAGVMASQALDDALRWRIDAACRDTIARTAECTDQQDHTAFAALFAPDALLQRPSGERLQGSAAIAAAYAARPAHRLTHHLLAGTVVDVIAVDSAKARTRVLLFTADGGQAPGALGRPAHWPALVGRFDDRLAPDAAGRWLICERIARFDLALHGAE